MEKIEKEKLRNYKNIKMNKNKETGKIGKKCTDEKIEKRKIKISVKTQCNACREKHCKIPHQIILPYILLGNSQKLWNLTL